MDENKDFEKVSRTVFDNLKMDPPENAWNRLDAALDKKQAAAYRQRANRFRWLSIGLVLLICSFVTWHYFSSVPVIPGSANATVEKNSFTDKNVEATNSDLSDKQEKLISSERNSATTVNREKNNSSGLIEHRSTPLASGVKAAGSQKNKKWTPVTKQNKTDNNINLSVVKPEDISGSVAEDINSNSNANDFTPVNDFTAGTNVAEQNSNANALSLSPVIVSADTNKTEFSGITKKDSLFTPDSMKLSPFSIAAFIAPVKTMSNLKDNTEDNFDDVSMYNSRENSELSWSAGVAFKYDLNKKWSLLSGINYSSISRSIAIETMYAEADSYNEMHYEYPTSSGVIVMPHDDTFPVPQKGDSMNLTGKGSQLIRFINVPLMVRFGVTKKKFTWFAEGGFSADFIIQEKATLNMNNSETTVTNHINGLNKMNYSFLAGAGVQYNMYNDFGIFIEPMFKSSITSITGSMEVNSYPYSLGINLGVSVRF